MQLNQTVDVLCKQIEAAEIAVRRTVKKYLPDATEEQITTEFQKCLGERLEEASDTGAVSQAFASDLAFAGVGSDAYSLASGLVARVSFHPRHVEAKTGGDFGLVLVRPKLEIIDGGARLVFAEEVGLLAQAKKLRQTGKPGEFTESQASSYAERSAYSSVVAYEFIDSENRELKSFAWLRCGDHTLNEMKQRLQARNLGDSLTTEQVIRELDQQSLGTNDSALIGRCVCPASCPTLRLELTWKDGTPTTGAFVDISSEDPIRNRLSGDRS